MIICLGNVLDSAALERVRVLVSQAQFSDGATTAGWATREVKNNSQLVSGEQHGAIARLALQALIGNELVQAAALPRTWHTPMVSRYETGMHYGRHVDAAMMGAPPVRTDISYTLFISDAADYEGGELVLEDAEGEHPYKLKAGSVLLYPSSYLHRVDPVRQGTRLVVVGWLESACADPRQREMLFDLYRARRQVHEKLGRGECFDLLSKTSSNLLRLFAAR